MKGYKEQPQVILEAKKAQDLWLAGLGLKKSHHFQPESKDWGKKKINVPTQVVNRRTLFLSLLVLCRYSFPHLFR